MERKDLSKLFHQTAGYAISRIKDVSRNQELKSKEPGNYFLTENPVFVSQIADADRTKIEKFYGKIKDRKAAERFGAKDLDEFSYWAWRSCGVAALEMVLKTEIGNSFKENTMDLVKQALEINGYDFKTDSGWFHSSILKIARKYGLVGNLLRFVPSSEIAVLIDQGKYSLASMKSVTGGHITWPYGYRINQNRKLDGFWINDPSTYYHEGEAQFMTKKEFDKKFTRRVIVINKK